MRTSLKTLIVASVLVVGIVAAPALHAQSTEDTPGSQVTPMGQANMLGMMKMMGQGGMMNMMDHGKKRHDFGGLVVPIKHLSIEDVRHFLEHRLARRGNKRLKVGEVKEQDEDAIIADIETVDDSLVERLKVNRHTGGIERVE